jgi:phosphatidylserine synthase
LLSFRLQHRPTLTLPVASAAVPRLTKVTRLARLAVVTFAVVQTEAFSGLRVAVALVLVAMSIAVAGETLRQRIAEASFHAFLAELSLGVIQAFVAFADFVPAG